MDPDTTLAAMRDTTLPTDERVGAAVDLLEWLHNGGFSPGALPLSRPRAIHLVALELAAIDR